MAHLAWHSLCCIPREDQKAVAPFFCLFVNAAPSHSGFALPGRGA